MVIKNCIQCGEQMVKPYSKSLRDWEIRSKYCSKACKHLSMKGHNYSIGTQFKKGQISHLKGKKRPEFSEDKHPNWKGDNVGYSGMHMWIRKQLGTPKLCAYCGATNKKKYEWANISHKYKRDVKDWRRLCTSCHRRYDYGLIDLT